MNVTEDSEQKTDELEKKQRHKNKINERKTVEKNR